MTHTKQAHSKQGTRVTALHPSLLVALAATSVLTISSSAAQQTQDTSLEPLIVDAEPIDPFNQLHTVVLEDGKMIRTSSVQLAIERIAQQGRPGDALQEKPEEVQKLPVEKPPAK